jgi:hypothetical protein
MKCVMCLLIIVVSLFAFAQVPAVAGHSRLSFLSTDVGGEI